jgi:hypothetical protein
MGGGMLESYVLAPRHPKYENREFCTIDGSAFPNAYPVQKSGADVRFR